MSFDSSDEATPFNISIKSPQPAGRVNERRPIAILIVSVFLLALLFVAFMVRRDWILRDCLPAPYVYVTSHDNNNIIKYSRDGCLLEPSVLFGLDDATQLRGMAIGRFRGQEVMYAASSANDAAPPYIGATAHILVFGSCRGYSHLRPFITSINTGEFGSYHPYSIAVDKDDNVYASFQHTDGVIRFAKDSLSPMPFPSSMYQEDETNQSSATNKFDLDLFPSLPSGTFVQFGDPGVHNITKQGIRGLAFVPSPSDDNNTIEGEYLWIANENHNRVFVVDSNANEVGGIGIHKPVGLYYHAGGNIVYVGSKAMNTGGAVYGIDPVTMKVVSKFTVIAWLMHPTGIVVYDDVLYVAEQSHNNIVTFNITTQRFIGRFAFGLEDDPVEQMFLSSC